MRFVAGRDAEAELLAGQGAVAERHREAVAGRGAVAERHQEAAADRGAVATEILLAGRCWQRRRKAASGRCCWQGVPEWAFTSLAHHA